MDFRDRAGSSGRSTSGINPGGETAGDSYSHQLHVHPSGNSYGFVKAKKKERGYKTVGLDSSDDDDDVAIMGSSHSPNQASASSASNKVSKGKAGFRLKKKKSLKDHSTASQRDTVDVSMDSRAERVQPIKEKNREKPSKSTSFKQAQFYDSHTNPFDDRPFAVPPGKKVPLAANISSQDEPDTRIFGIPLERAVQIDRCPDGLEIPAFFRVCINYIEDNGLDSLGVYRTAGIQSRIQELKQHFNLGDRVRLNDYDVPTVADVMKLFIRELPQKLVPEELVTELENAIDMPDLTTKMETTHRILKRLELCRRTLLGWIFVHMGHIIEHRNTNKMSVQNIALVLEPTLRIQSNKVLNFFLTYPNEIFHDIRITKLVAPSSTTPDSGRPLSFHPSTETGAAQSNTDQALVQLKEELVKKESSLNQLHHDIKQGKASKRKEEQLWDIQRQVTQIKRKIRTFEKMTTVTIQSESTSSKLEGTKSGQRQHVHHKSTIIVPLAPTVNVEDKIPVQKTSENLLPGNAVVIVETCGNRPVMCTTSVVSGGEINAVPSGSDLKDEADAEAESAAALVKKRESIDQAVRLGNLYEALLDHNRCLRERIRKESENLAGVYHELSMLSAGNGHQAVLPQANGESLDKEGLMRQAMDLILTITSQQKLRSGLADAVCSETADWINAAAELKSLKARNGALTVTAVQNSLMSH